MASFDQLPAKYDLNLVQGDYLEIPITVTKNALPVDITNYTFDAHVRTGNATQVNFSVVKTAPVTGNLTISLSMSQTALLAGTYTWEMDWLDNLGRRRSLLNGTVTVEING